MEYEINLSLFTLSNKLNYWRNKIDQSFSTENINIMNINIAVLIRRQIEDEIYISSISKNTIARDTNTHHSFQIRNPLKGFIENSSLDTPNLPR
jgi:hypothetical protein